MDAYFVVGPEGSGTNMLEEAFVSAGCYRDSRHASGTEPDSSDSQSPLVFRRSLPHAGKWPDLMHYSALLLRAGFAVRPVIIFRDWNATVQSVLRRNPESRASVIEWNMRKAIREIGNLIYPIYITYEAFCFHPEFRKWLFVEKLGLAEPDIEIKYANLKYYGGAI